MSQEEYDEVKLIFTLDNQEENVIKCHIKEKLINMFDLYCQIKRLKLDSVFLFYDNKCIENYNETLDNLLNKSNKLVKEAKFLVINKSNSKNVEYNNKNDFNKNNNNIDYSNKSLNMQDKKENKNNIAPPLEIQMIIISESNQEIKSLFSCEICENPINNGDILLCKNCFRNKIINESYYSYLSSLNKQRPPEDIIFANVNVTNNKGEKINFTLDKAIIEYNKLFPGLNFDRKNIILELKKKICIYCTKELKNNQFIELPCKCRICTIEHLNNYISFYKSYEISFTCRCKVTYNSYMMFQLGILKQLNNNNLIMIRNYFQKTLNTCCCICAKSSNIAGKSNTIICLEDQENNIFLHQLVHFFCGNCCRKFQNSEFNCHICHMKHFWNSN